MLLQVLAHSLDEHKRLVAAKQNQELLLAEHFSKVNITDPSGEEVEKDKVSATFENKEEIQAFNEANQESHTGLNSADNENKSALNDFWPEDRFREERKPSMEVGEILENSMFHTDDKSLLSPSHVKQIWQYPAGLVGPILCCSSCSEPCPVLLYKVLLRHNTP